MQQNRFDLAYWPWQFQNNPYIIGKTNSNLGLSFYNTDRKTKL